MENRVEVGMVGRMVGAARAGTGGGVGTMGGSRAEDGAWGSPAWGLLAGGKSGLGAWSGAGFGGVAWGKGEPVGGAVGGRVGAWSREPGGRGAGGCSAPRFLRRRPPAQRLRAGSEAPPGARRALVFEGPGPALRRWDLLAPLTLEAPLSGGRAR